MEKKDEKDIVEQTTADEEVLKKYKAAGECVNRKCEILTITRGIYVMVLWIVNHLNSCKSQLKW